jgi:hypothetical protein
MLESLPRGRPEQSLLAHLVEKIAEVREDPEDQLLLAATVEAAAVRARLIQGCEAWEPKDIWELLKTSLLAAKEGCATAQQVFIPVPTYMKLDDAKARLLEKERKEQEAKKKKEASKSESS